MKIKYVKGDVTKPELTVGTTTIIIHCCNDKGRMSSGVAKALYEKWPIVRERYIEFGGENHEYELGSNNIVVVDDFNSIVVVNMIGQHDTIEINGEPPIRYEAIRQCLKEIVDYSSLIGWGETAPQIIAPKFGSDLAGGKWEIIEQIIQEELIAKNIPITIYEFE